MLRLFINALALNAVIITASATSEIRTAADDIAFQERLDSKQKANFIYKAFQQELQRVTTESSKPPSPDVATILNDAGPHPDIGDLRVPLHLRFIERERITFVHSIQLFRTSFGRCSAAPLQEIDQLVDVQIRQRELSRIQCRRKSRAHYQRGAHELNLEREKSIFQLRLPAFTQAEMISDQRSMTRAQDLDIQERFALDEEADATAEEFYQFLDRHQATVHAMGGRFLFESDADAKRANELIQRWSQLDNQPHKPTREP